MEQPLPPAVGVGEELFSFPSVWSGERGELPSMRYCCVDAARCLSFVEVKHE